MNRNNISELEIKFYTGNKIEKNNKKKPVNFLYFTLEAGFHNWLYHHKTYFKVLLCWLYSGYLDG